MDNQKKCVSTIDVKLKGEVYSRRYARTDIEMVVNLINEMFTDEIHIEIIDCKEKVRNENVDGS